MTLQMVDVRKKESEKKVMGRPRIIDDDKLQKLREAFSNGFTDKQACNYADISPGTLYNYCKENPDFLEWKERIKLTPDVVAKSILVRELKRELEKGEGVGNARWWAENKMKDEFGNKSDDTPKQFNIAVLINGLEQKANDTRRKIIEQRVEDAIPLLDQRQTETPHSIPTEQSTEPLEREQAHEEHNPEEPPAGDHNIRDDGHAGRFVIRPKL